MTYTPNWQHAKIRARCTKVIDFCDDFLTKRKTFWLSRNEIYKHFGNTARQPGAYLKQMLLVEVDGYWNHLTGQCKKYNLNTQNLQELKLLIGYREDYTATPNIEQQLETADFEYTHSSNRQFHPLQFKPKHKKQRILGRHGFRYEFDIQAAAHTLLLQHARQLGHSTPTPTLDAYIENRTQFRNYLAHELGITPKTVKTILTGILQGAVISRWYTNSIFQALDHNTHLLEQLRNNRFIQNYQQECREMWRTIKVQRGISERMTGKKKSEIYRELENQVGKTIQRYLKKTRNAYFFEHDGWSCREMIDPMRLRDEVRQQTGFVIELDCTIYEEHM